MTRLFPPSAAPRVFGLPPGVDFTRELIAGLDARLAGQPPEAMARVEIWVNTRRTRRALVDALSAGPPRLLPRIRVVTEMTDDPLMPVDLPPPVSPLRRKLDLARLIAALIAAEPGIAEETAAFDLADSLRALFEEMQGEGVDPARLAEIDAGEHALHWRRSLRFLDILQPFAAAEPPDDAQGRMRAAALAWAARWAESPPDHPVVVAGSTGSRSATRMFMQAVAHLPQGALVLPGFDAGTPGNVWERLATRNAGAADHPQSAFRRLGAAVGFDAADIAPWTETPPPAPERNALVSLALRPAPVTDQWRAEGREMGSRLAGAVDGLTWLEAPDARGEARAIALRLRGAAEAGQRAALVTPDRTLARRVTAELDRWGVIPDDSSGRPLALTPPGVFLRRLAGLTSRPLAPDALLAVLKHPLCSSAAGARVEHLRRTAALELDALRGGPPALDWPALETWAVGQGVDAPKWLAWVRDALEPLVCAGTSSLADAVTRHRRAAETLAAGMHGGNDNQLWRRDAGEAALALLDEFSAQAAPDDLLDPAQYEALLRSELAARNVPEEAEVTDPDISIWGTLEARVQSADLVILGGLNEGVWPRVPDPDVWLSRGLRHAVGLPDREAMIGLSAHDFQQAMGAVKVVLSRAMRDAEAPSVASRWLLRLENLLSGLGPEGEAALKAAKSRGARLLAQGELLDAPEGVIPPARRPEPRPPLSARPAELSVTQIETLVRDPYAIYARKVLGLKRLQPLGREADALARGTALHAALEAFARATTAGLPPSPEELFQHTIRDSLAAAAPWPAVREFWIARLNRAAQWFLEEEAKRRAIAAPKALEIRGRRALEGLGHAFAVTAKADRIDVDAAGDYAIYDYKSGGVPSRPQADAFHLQLPLEAAIAAAGGFTGLSPGPALRLELIGLGARTSLQFETAPASIAETWRRLADLIGHFQTPENGFTARLRPVQITWGSDYDHLSRYGEWDDADAPSPEDMT